MTAKYAQRLEQAAQALETLSIYPNGLSIADLAKTLGTDEYDSRQNLAAYHEGQFLTEPYTASPLLLATDEPPETWDGVSRADWFDDHEAQTMEDAVWVALDRELGRSDPFGVMLDVPRIIELLTCADQLADQEPDNEDLRTAIAALRLRWLPQMTLASRTFPTPGALPAIRRAIVQRRRLRFGYTREWEPGTSERTVDPYELKRTQLGYELDAGPVREDGSIRTFLVRNMADVEVLEEDFEPPGDVDRIIKSNRRTMTFGIVVPKDARPSYESLVERLDVVGGDDDDDDDWELRVTLQQPFEERLALFMLRAGSQAFLVEDLSLMNHSDFKHFEQAAKRKADWLLAQHGLV